MTMTRILAIDGGGIRGILPARVLADIERRTGRRIAELFDVIAGTSTGGIIACGLAKPDPGGRPAYKAEALVNLYVDEGPRIFPHEFMGQVRSLFDHKYPHKGIEAVLERYFGDAMLSSSLTRVFVTAYDIERRNPFFFRSQDARNDPTRDFPLRMVARSTSAAPTYFEPFRLPALPPKDYFALVDGGVYANNPAMCAYVDGSAGQARVDQVFVVSLGTGSVKHPILQKEARKWGLLSWARPILDVVFDGVSATIDYQLRQVLGPDSYHRLQCDLDIAADNLDDASPPNLRKLQLQADQLIAENSAEIDVICARLTAGSVGPAN